MASNDASTPRLFRIPAEILNRILENAVINRDKEGNKRAIRWQSYLVLTRRHLGGMRACKKLWELAYPMYYGQNVFQITERTEGEPTTIKDSHRDDAYTIRTGLEILRYKYSKTYFRGAWHMSILTPALPVRPFIKNLELCIDIPKMMLCPANSRARMAPLEEKPEHHGSKWLAIVRLLGEFDFDDLDYLKITLTTSKRRTVRGWLEDMSMEEKQQKLELVHKIVNDFLKKAKVASKEVIVEYPAALKEE